MPGSHRPGPRPAYRTVAAEHLLARLGVVEGGVLDAVIRLRELGLNHLADSLNHELGHLGQIRIAAANQLRIEVAW